MLQHIVLDECHSTQSELKKHLTANSEPILVSCSKQSSGHGRQERQWDHYTGALAFSFSCRPRQEISWQALEVAVELQRFLQQYYPVELQLKWPNDLYNAHGKKCAGILLQHQAPHMLVGVGINLTYPQSTDFKWGHLGLSLTDLADDFTHSIPRAFCEYFLNRPSMKWEEIQRLWMNSCCHWKKMVTITEGEQQINGVFHGLGEHGEALISTEDGIKQVYNGTLRWQS